MTRVPCLLGGLALFAAFLVSAAPGSAPAEAAGEPAPLAAPQWVSGVDARGKAQLTWVHSPSFASVRVYRRDEAAGSVFRPLAQTRENTWLDDTVEPGRTYRYRLVGLDAQGREGRPSSELAVRIGLVSVRPPAPPQWDGYLLLDGGVGLKWSAREGEDVIAWNVYRRTLPGAEFQLVGSTRGTSFSDLALAPGQYVYVLTALDSAFRETPYSPELSVTIAAAPAAARPADERGWRVRRTRRLALVHGGKDLRFARPADVVVGPVSGRVYVADSGRNLIFVFTAQGDFQRTIGAGADGRSAFANLLGLGADRHESLFAVDAGTGMVQSFTPQGAPGRRLELRTTEVTGLIDVAAAADGRIYVVDNFNHRVTVLGSDGGIQGLGQPGARPGEFAAPGFCAVDAAGSFYVADGLNARVQVFSADGEFMRAFGRPERAPGGLGRPKGVAVSEGGEVYVADSWLNSVQVFDGDGRFVALLGDEEGRPLDLGSPNGVALGPGNRVYVAERLAGRLQVLELIDVP